MIPAARYQSLHELIGDALVQYKSRVALIEVDRKREAARFTYADFRREAMRFARWLEVRGVAPGDRVAILMSNQSKWLLAAYAVFTRGAVLVPLDYKLSADEQKALLAHARPKALIVEHPLFRRFDALDVPDVVVTEAPADAPLAGAIRWEEARSDGTAEVMPRRREDVATIVYSSGTGGRAKGCMLSHGAYLSQYESLMALFPMQDGERYFSILPTNHAIDFMCGFIGPFGCGATVVHQRTLRPELIAETMRNYRITHMALVPMVLGALERAIREKLDALPPWKRTLVDGLATVNESLTRRAPNPRVSRMLLGAVHEAFGGELKLFFCGGAFVERSRAEFFYRLGIPVVIGYGLTEACTVATVNDLKPFRGDSVGKPVPGVDVRVLDPDPSGVGDVVLGGPTLMSGYLDDPELTGETIRDGVLHTGDRGYFDAAGHLHLVGRSKNMIVTEGGKNIYPEDIEGAFGDVPVDELAVFSTSYLWPNTKLTEESLVAVVRKGSDGALPAELLARLRERNLRLPDFKRLQGVVAWKEPFPRTASMKLKRGELAAVLREQKDRGAVQSI